MIDSARSWGILREYKLIPDMFVNPIERGEANSPPGAAGVCVFYKGLSLLVSYAR